MNDTAGSDPTFLIWKGMVLVRSSDGAEIIDVRDDGLDSSIGAEPVYAGAGGILAYILDAADEVTAQLAAHAIASGAIFIDAMMQLERYAPPLRAALLRAIAVERWSNRYRFCPACGYALDWTTDAIAKICANPTRVHRHFPRLDPAIIVLVTSGERALLGRAARWPPGWYSTLAGFVEPGETLEAAVRREVREEAGITVDTMRYFGSESWPFPRSLMLGFLADASDTTISLNDAELEEARWFDLGELHALQASMKKARPFFDTIARRMIDHWLARPRGR